MSYQSRLSKLENEIYEKTESPWLGVMTTAKNYKKYIPYPLITVISLVLLYLIRPKWMTKRVSRHVTKICISKFLILWMILSTSLGLVYYRYGSNLFSSSE